MRYRLQVKETVVRPNILGNHSFPVYTHRWKDIYASDSKAELEAILPKGNKYRIEDTRPYEAESEDKECARKN